ncbi:MAG: aspartate kinase [Mangrovibacterium sp.]
MRVFKFGGASVSSAEAIRHVANLLRKQSGRLIVVVSAMGKTTNALEDVVKKYFNRNSIGDEIEQLAKYHKQIIAELGITNHAVIKKQFNALRKCLEKEPSLDFNYEYDRIVSFGELFSTSIISAYLNEYGLSNEWIDIRTCLRTDAVYREANVDWELTENLCKKSFSTHKTLYITQGFIGATRTNQTTTLGREGSDFTAAILASVLNAESVSIWKNVPGVLNADPNDFDCTEKLRELSYKEAIELAYSGAKVIHPKTMKPLRNKGIPLYVRSFENPNEEGTIIHQVESKLDLPPIYIQKKNQALITLEPNDFSFVGVNELAEVFNYFKERLIKVNLIQQSAIQFSLCIDEPEFDIQEVVSKLNKHFKVLYNSGLTLATIRYYNDKSINRMVGSRVVLMEQRSRRTIKMVLQ